MGTGVSHVRVTGPLAPFVAGFIKELESKGYRASPACLQLRLLAHVSRWLRDHSLEVGELTNARVEEFLLSRRTEGYAHLLSAKVMVPIVNYRGCRRRCQRHDLRMQSGRALPHDPLALVGQQVRPHSLELRIDHRCRQLRIARVGGGQRVLER